MLFRSNSNVPDYKGNAEKLTLEAENRDSAQAYIIWDEDYLYVLFDVNDPDIAPASGDHYDTDSVEFFLDEDYDRPTSYVGDEIQVRVDAFDAAFSANDAGTAGYEYVARAREFKYDDTENPEKPTGYQIQYVIPFMSKHKSGDMMGMDLQINDCFTVATETTDDEENPITVYSPDRAGTLTAYDTSNNAYADPSCFGRVKLFDKNAVTDEGEGEGEGELGYIELPLTKRTAVSLNNKVTANEDGTVTIEFGPAAFAGVTFEFEESQDLSEYNYVHVDATLDSEKQNLNFSLVDSELKDEWNGPLPAGIQYGVPTFPFTFDMAAKANSNNANGYSKVLGVTIFTGASAGFDNGKGTITIHSIRAYKSLDDMLK